MKTSDKTPHQLLPLRKLASPEKLLDLDDLGLVTWTFRDEEKGKTAQTKASKTPARTLIVLLATVCDRVYHFLDHRSVFSHSIVSRSFQQIITPLPLIIDIADDQCRVFCDYLMASMARWRNLPSSPLQELHTLRLVRIRDKTVDVFSQAFSQGAFHAAKTRLRVLAVEFAGDEGLQSARLLLDELTMHTEALHTLDLSGSYLGEEGVEEVAALLKKGGCRALTHLDLSRNGLGDVGLRALAEALVANTRNDQRLSCLKLKRNVIHSGVTALFRQLAHGNLRYLSTLDLSDNSIPGSAVARDLVKAVTHCSVADTWKSLDLSGNPIGDDALSTLFRAISKRPKCNLNCLEDLRLTHVEMGDGAMEALSGLMVQGRLERMRCLDISFNRIRPEGIVIFASALRDMIPPPQLESLSLAGNYVQDEGLRSLCHALRGMTSLVRLDVSMNGLVERLTHLSFTDVEESCPNLREIIVAADVGILQ